MKLNKLILATSLLLSSAFALSAQEEVTEYVYKPNWYIQGQFGGQETLGENSFGKLLSPTAQVAVGYNFNPYIGLRLAVNGWGSKATTKLTEITEHTYRWKWNYVSGNLDVTFNLTNILGGYKPNRLVDVDIFAGIGANVGWNNKEAHTQNDLYHQNYGSLASNQLQEYLWDGTHTRFMGNFGADIWFNCSQHVAVGLELNANMINDHYNSKKADNIDWYFNGMVGVRYTFGKKYTKTTRVIEPNCPPCEETIVEKIVERVVEVPVVVEQAVEEKKAEPLRRDIFFTISNTVIPNSEKYKVDEIAIYLKEHPTAVVYVTGYADKGTGSKTLNLRLSKQRATAVYNALVNQYGIAKDRIHVASMDDSMEQPYSTPKENRVAICIAEEI